MGANLVYFWMLTFANLANHEYYMNRCLHLAKLGAGHVAPNPMVGAVLVYNDIIIGEGYHQQFGGPHAEVNCLNSVSTENQGFITQSRLYVSLEPCAHFGKTAPCVQLIIRHKIPEVVIGCSDPFIKVNGLGIQQLREAGISVTENLLEKEAQELNKRFFCFHNNKRPYVFLKWAQSSDGFIAGPDFQKLAISNGYSQRYTHRMRAQEAAILVGTNTVIHDNPSLSTRYWPGKNPLKIIIDKELKVTEDAAVFTHASPLLVLNYSKEIKQGRVHFHKIPMEIDITYYLLSYLYEQNINSLIVEGGTRLLQSFINAQLWDEALIITNTDLLIGEGIAAPLLTGQKRKQQFSLFDDTLNIYKAARQ
jgi:diaminohydroxyphosphoribosylaminopyrimidine deaminase / 5-amino-6-(5-phosphoribosylamino)uracil reductase